jgi:catechol 2,3-dioxygenase-like lactoylglutathione lyase family enzyme
MTSIRRYDMRAQSSGPRQGDTAPVIASIDHVVLTTRDEKKCIEFYTSVLGMRLERYGTNRLALCFGSQKINVHQPGLNADLVAQHPTAGSLDLCFIAAIPIADVVGRLKAKGITIIAGPVPRSGARGPIQSVYVRDPDDNLVEIAVPMA